MMPITIHTIGHGRAGFADVAEVLEQHGMATIVDVRSQPFSRHAPEFSRRLLEELAAAAGLGYRWMGDVLGGRPDDPALLLPDGGPDYEAIRRSPGFRAALVHLAALAAEAGVVLLCAEERPEHCHRALLIAPALEEMGLRVVHLLHDGTALAHQPPLAI
jgi:ATP-dependent DNA helicase RecQ